MAEEFQESDVVFSDHHRQHPPPRSASSAAGGNDDVDDYRTAISLPELNRKSMRSAKKEVASSLPVSIPAGLCRRNCSGDQLEEEWDDEGMVPPYVIADRRIAGKMAFSVRTGNGRTLKGRDLSQVRNSILRMTGFLEA